jgi:hypothetical protein
VGTIAPGAEWRQPELASSRNELPPGWSSKTSAKSPRDFRRDEIHGGSHELHDGVPWGVHSHFIPEVPGPVLDGFGKGCDQFGLEWITQAALKILAGEAQGLAALEPRHAGGPAILYDAAAKERILAEFRRNPDHERDGTPTWSLTTLQRALRRRRNQPTGSRPE